MEELLEVVSFHLPRYEQTVKTCQNDPGRASPSDLTFATKFLATYLFIKVKGSRPKTYQYLTVEMIKEAKANGGFIDQKTFKTAGKYGFDSVILTDTSMQILDGYMHFVRPLLKPRCDFVLVTKNGSQHSKLGNEMSRWSSTLLANTSTPRVVAKSSKRKVFTRSTTKSIEFCPKTKNIAL